MDKVVTFPGRRNARLERRGNQPAIVTITDTDGACLFSCPILPEGEGAVAHVPDDRLDRAFVKAALRQALSMVEEPETDPEIGADYVPV